jgi:hypothetical protein
LIRVALDLSDLKGFLGTEEPLVKGNSFGLTVCYKLTKCGCFLGFSGAAS